MLRRSLLAAPLILPAAAARAQAAVKMTIGTGVDPSFAPFYCAKEGGFFERNGLDVTVNTGASGSAMVAFLIGDQINAAFGAEQAGVSAHNVDANVVAIAEGTTLLRWMSVVGREIADLAGLRGKRIGLARGTASETLWLSLLAKQNMNAADYTVVYVDAPEMVAAMERGNIDAFVVWEPWVTRGMRAVPNTRILISNDQIQLIRNFIYVNRAWATANTATMGKFIRALIQANDFLGTNRGEAARQVARFLRQDRALMEELMTKLEYPLNLTADSLANFQVAINQLRGMGRLTKEVTPAEVVWADALRGIAPERVRI